MAVYDSYYGFHLSPFSISPDPRFLFLSRRHREALAGLTYAVRDGKGFAVLTGEVGTGKTTVVHALLRALGDQARSALLFTPRLSRRDLYLHLLAEFQLEPGATTLECIRALQRFLLQQFQAGCRIVVVLDEAHALSPSLLEEVRLLSNFETSQSKLLQVLLVGQPELMQRLENADLRQLRQRLALRFELVPFDFEETVAYVRFRLSAAGANRELFTPRAYVAVHRFSGGAPRLINILCDNALLSGFARDCDQVDHTALRRAAKDLGLRPRGSVRIRELLFGPHRTPLEQVESAADVEVEARQLEGAK